MRRSNLSATPPQAAPPRQASPVDPGRLCSYALMLLAFSIPLSTAATYMVLGLFLLCCMLDNIKTPLKALNRVITSNLVALAGCAFFLIHIPGLLYTHAGLEKMGEGLQNGGKFLFISICMIYLQEQKTARAVLTSFICAMGVVLVLSCLIRIDMVPGFIPVKGSHLDCYVFHDHIKHNTFMAFTAFVTAVRARFARTPGVKLLWAGFSILALVNVLFMVNGRIGHVILLLLGLYYFLSWNSRKRSVAFIATCLCMGTLMWCYPANPVLTRARMAYNEIAAWRYGEPASISSSSGLRLEFYTNALELIAASPFIGTGTGSFQAAYSELIKGTRFTPSDNPHNEFLMAGVQFGMVGIAALLAFFITQWRYAASLNTREAILLARGLVLTMMTACMVASPLQDSAEGWFFALMSAVLSGPAFYLDSRPGSPRAVPYPST